MNPTGRAVDHDLLAWLTKTYQFQKTPASAFDFDSESKTLSFLGGKFKAGSDQSGNDRYVAVGVTVYKDGLVAMTESSTTDSELFLQTTIDAVVREFNLTSPEVRKKLYYSEMDVLLDRSFYLVNPKIAALAKQISNLRPEDPKIQFEFSGISCLPQPDVQASLSAFNLERKVNTDWAENRYFTRAPLQTHAHIKLVEEIESLLIE
jgi:hypothetical protein